MSEEERLQHIKNALGITGNYQDNTLKSYIDEVMLYMMDAGVHKSVAESKASLGAIARGVSDLWNYKNGRLSSYFYQRVNQLSCIEGDEDVSTN